MPQILTILIYIFTFDITVNSCERPGNISRELEIKEALSDVRAALKFPGTYFPLLPGGRVHGQITGRRRKKIVAAKRKNVAVFSRSKQIIFLY